MEIARLTWSQQRDSLRSWQESATTEMDRAQTFKAAPCPVRTEAVEWVEVSTREQEMEVLKKEMLKIKKEKRRVGACLSELNRHYVQR